MTLSMLKAVDPQPISYRASCFIEFTILTMNSCHTRTTPCSSTHTEASRLSKGSPLLPLVAPIALVAKVAYNADTPFPH